MSVVINMSKMRKAMDRAKAQAQADANALKFGRTRQEKLAEQSASSHARRSHDGHELDRE